MKTNKLTGFLLVAGAFLMVLMLVPQLVFADAAEYPVEVLGVQVTDSNKGNILGDGKVSYDPDTRTLTLNDFKLSNYHDYNYYDAIYVSEQAITIKAIGNVEIRTRSGYRNAVRVLSGDLVLDGTFDLSSRKDDAVYVGGNLTIEGKVTASATGGSYDGHSFRGCGIRASHDIVVNGELNSSGSEYGVRSENGSVTLNGGPVTIIQSPDDNDARYALFVRKTLTISCNVHASSKYSSAIVAGDVVINDGTVTAESEGERAIVASISDTGKSITINDGTVNAEACSYALSADAVTISGGSVTARSTEWNGIAADDVEITGGTVTSTGLNDNGIEADNIIISGGTVTANVTANVTGGSYAGIRANNTLSIRNGIASVTAQGENGAIAIHSGGGIRTGGQVKLTTPSDGTVSQADGKYTVTKPDGSIADLAVFETDPSSGYAVSVEYDNDPPGGSVTPDKTSALEGEEVSLTVTPDAGYELAGLSVFGTDDPSNTYTVTDDKFTMPAEDVTVRAQFSRTEEEAPVPDSGGSSAVPEKNAGGILLARMSSGGGRSLVVSWNDISGADGYDIFFAGCSQKELKYAGTSEAGKTRKWKKSGLKKRKAYKACVRAYVIRNGVKTYVSSSPTVYAYTSGGTKKYTNAKKVKVKKSKVSLKEGKTFRIRATVSRQKKGKKLMPARHAPKLRYLSGNAAVATVSRSGKVSAKSKGSCDIYVIAANGVKKTVRITVR